MVHRGGSRQDSRFGLKRALDAGVPASWVTADEVYGGNPALRGWLETRAMPFVLAVKRSEPLPRRTGRPRQRPGWPSTSRRRTGCASAPARVPRATAGAPEGWERWQLVRRSLTTGELAYYVGAGPAGLPLVDLVRVAGCRWRVEEAFQAGKGLCGLDEYQVRHWRSWYRWVTLAMLAYASGGGRGHRARATHHRWGSSR
jgi:SRSO17 transposase